MSVDLETQLTHYGEVLREAMHVSTSAVSDEQTEAATIAGPGGRRDHRRVLYLVALLAVALGVGGLLVETRRSAELSGAVAIEDPTAIELQAGDTPAFLERLAHVDFELGSRPTATQRADAEAETLADEAVAPIVKRLSGFTYGCAPAREVLGRRFGKRDFSAQVFMPGTPGVIFTLENGDLVLVRPLGDRVFYNGPPAVQMEIFDPAGAVQTIDTSDCW